MITSAVGCRRIIILLATVPAWLLLDGSRENLTLGGGDLICHAVEDLGVLVGGVGDGGDDPWLSGVLGDLR